MTTTSDGASADAAEATTMIDSPMYSSGLRPKRSDSGP